MKIEILQRKLITLICYIKLSHACYFSLHLVWHIFAHIWKRVKQNYFCEVNISYETKLAIDNEITQS